MNAPQAVLAVEPGIVVRDLARMTKFVQDVLGLALHDTFEVEGVGRISRFRRDVFTMKLFRPLGEVRAPFVAKPNGWAEHGGWRYITLTVPSGSDVEDLASRAVQAGARLLLGPVEKAPGYHVVVFADVEENVWEAVCRPAR